ncbi:MAG: hypothetical protein ACUZ8O_12490, partial [Candidatus Anammoxibacter sp.]
MTSYSYAISIDVNSNTKLEINKGSFSIKGDVNVQGTLTASNSTDTTIGLTGTWTVSGSFVPGSSTVNFTGTNQFLMGTSTFFNLTKSVT